MANSARSLSAPSPWIWDPVRDMAFFILPPLFIIPLVLAIQDRVDISLLGMLVLGIGGFGHHLPGFIRAYSDREMISRYKFRLLLVPALLIVVCGYAAYHDLHAVTFAVALWGTWHGAMQVNGFLRIYDAKVKSISPVTARLDWLMCLAWFGAVILHSPMRGFSLFSHFYISGGPLIPPAGVAAFRYAWDAGTAAITLAFVANVVVQWRRGAPPSPLKLLSFVLSVGFFWYCMTWTANLMIGVVMWEIFHDVQYNALIWLTQQQRIRSGAPVSRLEKTLFSPGAGRVAVYLLLIAAYGYIGVASSFMDIHFPEKVMEGEKSSRWMLQIIAVSALLHFYFDGFIWRIRNRGIRQGLGLNETAAQGEAAAGAHGRDRNTTVRQGGARAVKTAAGANAAGTAGSSGRLAHAAKWILFLAPVGALAYAQLHHLAPDPRAITRNLSEILPDSWSAHFMSATFYKLDGDYDNAAIQFQEAVRTNPNFDMAHVLLADVLFHKDSLRQSLEHYRIAVELEPKNVEARANLAYLYMITGRPDMAVGEYRAALEAVPGNIEYTMGLATVLMKTGRLPEAETRLQAVVASDPRNAEALNYLGMVRHTQGRLQEATDLYRRALAADPSHAGAAENLAAAQAASQQPAEDSLAAVGRRPAQVAR